MKCEKTGFDHTLVHLNVRILKSNVVHEIIGKKTCQTSGHSNIVSLKIEITLCFSDII